MTVFTKTAVDVFAAQDASGAARKVSNHDVQVWGTEVERALAAFQAGGGVIFQSKDQAEASLNYEANTMAWVLGDPIASNNGVYQKQGASGSGSWQRVGDLPYSFILATNTNSGDPNAIEATTATPIPAADGGALIALPIVADNTSSPVTVSFNGGLALTVKTIAGNDVTAAALAAGMIVWGFKQGDEFRLVTDLSSAAIQAAAEAAAAEAEAARDVATGAMTTVIDPQFSTIATAEAYSPDVAPDYIRTAGYAAAGDGGGALYKKVASEPTHTGKFSITLSDGETVVWYEIAATSSNTYASRELLKALSPDNPLNGQFAYLAEDGREGWFKFRAGDFSAQVASDPHEGVYIAPDSDPTGASGAWVRQYDTDYVMIEWFGAKNFEVGGSQDSTTAFQAAVDFAGIGGAVRWKGLHRITGTITSPGSQKIGSFGGGFVPISAICSNQRAFTGVNTSSNWRWLHSCLFVDLPAGGPAFLTVDGHFHDFIMYGKGPLATDGSEDLLYPQPDPTQWHDDTAIRYSKHIEISNVGFALFRRVLDSREVGGVQGNYYSKINRMFVRACHTAFSVYNTPSYNTEVRDTRLSVARFAELPVDIINFKFFGGSVESLTRETVITGGMSDISFYSTYFENAIRNPGLSYFAITGSNAKVRVSFRDCSVRIADQYGFLRVANPGSSGPIIVISEGNRFIIPPDANDTLSTSHTIYSLTLASVVGGHLISDTVYKNGNTKTFKYHDVDNANFNPYTAIVDLS